jgi:hypothetical protein
MGSPYIGVSVEAEIQTQEAFDALRAAALLGIRHVFESAILPDAKANCPVGTDPIETGSTRNRDSLQVEAWITRRGPFGKLFSTSGHGGFVEVGTVNMSGQPYAWPALQKNIPALMDEIKTRLAAITVPSVQLGRVQIVDERNI